jgi:hypothetical protein
LYFSCKASLNNLNEKGCVHHFDAEAGGKPSIFLKKNLPLMNEKRGNHHIVPPQPQMTPWPCQQCYHQKPLTPSQFSATSSSSTTANYVALFGGVML